MGTNTRRWLLGAGVGSVLVMSSVTASASAGSPKFDPAAATSACAHGRAPGAQLGAADVGFLAHFVPCVLRYYRAQAGLR